MTQSKRFKREEEERREGETEKELCRRLTNGENCIDAGGRLAVYGRGATSCLSSTRACGSQDDLTFRDLTRGIERSRIDLDTTREKLKDIRDRKRRFDEFTHEVKNLSPSLKSNARSCLFSAVCARIVSLPRSVLGSCYGRLLTA
eukprot:298567-Rhodomonas_salina.1